MSSLKTGDLRAMFLCRATLGKILYTADPSPDVPVLKQAMLEAACHTPVGEFVVSTFPLDCDLLTHNESCGSLRS